MLYLLSEFALQLHYLCPVGTGPHSLGNGVLFAVVYCSLAAVITPYSIEIFEILY